jgi:hypothetical protein
MGEIFAFRKNGGRPDQTPKSFALEDWRSAIARGGYWSELLGYFVPVRMVSEEEFWEDSLLPEFWEAGGPGR